MQMVVCFGTLCLDRVHRVPQLPRAGGYVEAIESQCFLGGEAANTTVALRALDVQARLHSNPIGDDENGHLLDSLMKKHGLNEPMVVPGYQTPVTEIYVTPDGERTMFGAGFSTMDSEEISLPDLDGATWLTSDPNMPKASRKVVEHAQRSNAKTYLMDFFKLEQDSLTANCQVWQSSTDWVGERGDTEENLRWVEDHSRRFGCATILTDGPRGLFAASPEFGARSFPAFPCRDIADTTGAGDIFRAGVIAGLTRNLPLQTCLLYGAAAACLSIQSLGATSNLPTIQEIELLISASELVARCYE